MKSTSVLNLLMYLFRNQLHQKIERDYLQQTLLPKLEEAGFEKKTIYSAFDWLEQLGKPFSSTTQTAQAIRLYDKQEQLKLDLACRGFLCSLEQTGVLKPHLREKVITQVLALEEEAIDIHLIKWVTLLVLFTQPNEKSALAYMEHLVSDEALTLQ